MDVSELINAINGFTESPTELKDDERAQLLFACKKLENAIEGPREKLLKIVTGPHQGIALQLAVDMELFDAAAEVKGQEINVEQLAARKQADPFLVARTMRFIVGMGFFKELGPGRYVALPISNALVSSAPFGQAIIHLTSQNEVISALPSYFAKNGYKSPEDAYDSPFQFARNTKLHAFEWLATQPRLQHAFNVLMTMPRGGPNDQKWFDYYPVSSKLQVTSPSDVLLVDIGGGVGHDLIAFQKRYPDLSGQYIVQDIPVVIDSITSLPTGITAQKHDFFGLQPVKNAKAYYLANILHDWPDKQARKILQHITDAMNEDSLVLINENVMPEENVDLYSASADFVMMANFSALERTEKQFRELLDSAGLSLVSVYMSENAANGKGEQKARRLLEAVKKV
ncbi:hypothetical protein ACMFMG_002658 [Clarireedia jacksonii]